MVVHLDRSLVFPAVNHVRGAITKIGLGEGRSVAPVVVDCSHVYASDYTAAEGLSDMTRDFEKRGQAVLFLDMQKDVEAIFKGPDDRGVITVVRGREHLQSVLRGNKRIKVSNEWL